MDVRTHLRIMWRYRVWVVSISALVALAVLVLSSSASARYVANAQLQVLSDPTSDQPQDRSVFLANGYAELAETAPVLRSAVETAGFSLTVDQAHERVDASAVDDFGFIRITAEASSPEDATALASAVAGSLTATVQTRADEQFQARLAPLEARIAELRDQIESAPAEGTEAAILSAELDSVVASRSALSIESRETLTVVESAEGTATEVSSQALATTVTALLVALILNSELAVGLHVLADRLFVDDEDEVAAVTGLPVLARLTFHDDQAASDTFRDLRTTIGMRTSASIRRLAVVGFGDQTRVDVTAGLGEAMADLGVPVVIVDTDLRDPEIHRRFSLHRGPGLGDADTGTPVNTLLQRVNNEPHLRVLGSGRTSDDPGRVIFLHLQSVLDELSDAEVTLVNTSDAERWSDAFAAASLCDSTLIVLADGDRRRAARRLAETLRADGANPIGIVVHLGNR